MSCWPITFNTTQLVGNCSFSRAFICSPPPTPYSCALSQYLTGISLIFSLRSRQIRPKSQRKPMTGWLRWKANIGKNVPMASGLSASILGRSSSSEIPGGPQDAANTTPMKKQSSVNQFRESHVENGVSPASEVDDESSDDEDSFGERLQYTVKSIKKNENCADQMLGFLAPNVDENVYTPNTLFCRYLNWTFRSGFFMVFLTFLVFFMVLTLAFGVFLEIAGKRNPECIVVAGEPFGKNPNTTLADAYGLSWTTVRSFRLSNCFISFDVCYLKPVNVPHFISLPHFCISSSLPLDMALCTRLQAMTMVHRRLVGLSTGSVRRNRSSVCCTRACARQFCLARSSASNRMRRLIFPTPFALLMATDRTMRASGHNRLCRKMPT